jgi:hypothetical protein
VKVLEEPGSGGPSCRLVSDVFDAAIRIEGLTAPELRARLFERGASWPWHRLIGRSPLKIELLGDRSDFVAGRTAAVERDLTDGQVRLVSGGPSELNVRADHVDSEALLPSALYLCFAHQWARIGLLPVHGAAFVTDQGGVLAIGGTGTGKSTLTAAALIAGCRVVSDDWLLARASPDGLVVERLRRFIMLRRGWASDRVLARLPGLAFRNHHQRPKITLRLPPRDDRFPNRATATRLFELTRPHGARDQSTRVEPLTAHDAMAALIQSSMPLLFSEALPIERSRLLAASNQAMRHLEKSRLIPGSALVDDPCREVGRLGLLGGFEDGSGKARNA